MAANRYDTTELLRRYLSGALTAPEEAELERRARKDPVLAEALRGLRTAPAADHTARVQRMTAAARTRAGKRTPAAVTRRLPRRWYYAAAATLLLLVAAVFLLPRFTASTQSEIAMTEAAPAQMPPAVQGLPPPEAEEPPAATPTPESAVAPRPVPAAAEIRPQPATTAPTVSDAPQPPAAVTNAAPRRAEAGPEEIEEEIAGEESPDNGVTAPTPSLPLAAGPTAIPEDNIAREAAGAHAEEDRKAAERQQQLERFRKTSARIRANRPPGAGRLVVGRITDPNGQPIPLALVRLPGLPLGQRTDSNGVFRLEVDAVTSELEISHPDFSRESVRISDRPADLQITLDREREPTPTDWTETGAVSRVPLNQVPGYALPEEGYAALRTRIEQSRPADVPPGKVRLSFLVHPDGSLSDFIFRGEPDRATMDYIGETLIMTSIWKVLKGEDPVRVHFRVNFE